jgi:hypothetical protein
MKKRNNRKQPHGVGACAPASPAPKPAANNLLAALKRNAERATEPELKQRLHDAIRAMEDRRRGQA